MATIKVEPQTAVKSLPDFTFPPKYPSTEVITTPPTCPSLPPNFGFVSSRARNPSPGPTYLPEIQIPITPLDNSIPSSKRPTLLTIPLEIRLQIYHYVLLSHPVHHAHLSPLVPPKKQDFHTTMLRLQGLSYPVSSQSPLLFTSTPFATSHPSSTRSVDRQTRSSQSPGKIPTALLSSCRQIYDESRAVPFAASSFTFVNWFWSGVYAARQFSRSLRPWQSESLRYAAVEVLGRDLWVGGIARIGGGIGAASSTGGLGGKEGKGVGEWRELCALWTGVWRLRLKIKGSVVLNGRDINSQVGWNGEDGKWMGPLPTNQDSQDEEQRKHQDRGIFNAQMEWVIDGLLRMKILRWIELEIEDEDVERDVKMEFCAELEGVLSEMRVRDDGWEGGVQVVFVEPAVEVEEEGKWYAGEPGDDEDWHD